MIAAILAFFTSGLFIRLIAFTALTAIAAAFTTEMVGYAQQITAPSLHPRVIEGFGILPPNTSTYITLMISAVIGKWLFIAATKAISALR
jgi:hypothetical protein